MKDINKLRDEAIKLIQSSINDQLANQIYQQNANIQFIDGEQFDHEAGVLSFQLEFMFYHKIKNASIQIDDQSTIIIKRCRQNKKIKLFIDINYVESNEDIVLTLDKDRIDYEISHHSFSHIVFNNDDKFDMIKDYGNDWSDQIQDALLFLSDDELSQYIVDDVDENDFILSNEQVLIKD